MAENWPWETSHKTQHSSPLQSGSSQSNQEATAAVVRQTQQQQQEQQEQPPPRPTLVETLQTCLATTTQPGRSLSDPSVGVTAATTARQSRSSGALSGSTVSMKRRRMSRRIPPTVVEATSSDFKETVHRLTGIAPPAPQPVRPQPKRAAPAAQFIRPYAATPDSSPPLLSSLLNVTAGAPAGQPVFWHQLQQRMGAPSLPQPQFDPFIKNEEIGGPSSTPVPTTWWDAVPQSYGLMNPSTTTAAFDVSTSSGGRILEDDPELSMDDQDLSWFQHDHSGSDYMR